MKRKARSSGSRGSFEPGCAPCQEGKPTDQSKLQVPNTRTYLSQKMATVSFLPYQMSLAVDQKEKRDKECEHRLIEGIQSEEQKENFEKSYPLVTCVLTYVLGVPEGRRRNGAKTKYLKKRMPKQPQLGEKRQPIDTRISANPKQSKKKKKTTHRHNIHGTPAENQR